MNIVPIIILIPMMLASCSGKRNDHKATFMVADPGHFHAALVLKTMYPDVGPSVYVYAPEGPELTDFLGRVCGYGNRPENPATWDLKTYAGQDFFNRMLTEKPGNVLVLAGNNRQKTEYIDQAIGSGIHVYSDKPMAINTADFLLLEKAFAKARQNGLLIYDIMTERFEITSILQKELSLRPEIFGRLENGTPESPSVIKESVHHFFKHVSGSPLVRPAWFYDVEQEGEGIVDVTTHLVDLVQWTCFPDQTIDYKSDILISGSRKWNTGISPDQFLESTGLDSYPVYLKKYIGPDNLLLVACNGEINYQVKGLNAKVSVMWNYKAPEGGGDTHFSLMKGSLVRLEIRQGPEQKFKPELYLIPGNESIDYQNILSAAIKDLSEKYPGLFFERAGSEYHILIPEQYRVGHEDHFGQVTRNFLKYLKDGRLPDWEVPNMLAKYWLTTQAKEKARL